MIRRSGVTLTEVLMAMFVLAIGLMGILALYPVAAIQMAQAIKDDNCAVADANATAQIRPIWQDEVAKPNPRYAIPLAPPPYADTRDPFFGAMRDVNFPWNPDFNTQPYVIGAGTGAGDVPPAFRANTTNQAVQPYYQPYIGPTTNLNRPGYPVFVDPVGWNNPNNAGTVQQYWVGNDYANGLFGIPRRSYRVCEYSQIPATGLYTIPIPTSLKTILLNRYFVKTDDLTFTKGDDTNLYNPYTAAPYNGGMIQDTSSATPNPANFNIRSGEVQRDGRYTWAYLLRRSHNNQPNIANLTVVVYSGRSLDGPANEYSFTNSLFVKGSTEAVITYAGARPPIRKGTWILDATTHLRLLGQINPHGFFYRIVNVTETTPGTLSLELQTPARESTLDANGNPVGLAVFLENVAEVFERNTISNITAPVAN